MDKYDIKIGVVLNGKQHLIDGKSIIDVKENKLPMYIRHKIKPNDLMTKAVKHIYNIDVSFDGNICGYCARMLHCPKVTEQEKRLLKGYPYITDGIEVILIDNEIRSTYNDALKEYNVRKNDPDFYLDGDRRLEDALNNNGIEVPIISVFDCKKFISDYEDRLVKKPKKR